MRDWLPRNGVPAAVRAVLDGCPVGGGGEAASIDPDWGEPGLTPAEKIYGWNSFIVLAMLSGRPENPVNAVAPNARAHCQIRYTVDTDPAGFERRPAPPPGRTRASPTSASRTPASACRRAAPIPAIPGCAGPSTAWSASLGKRVQVIPNSSGGLPGDVFVDYLGVPLVWIPHSYNGCKQHGPDEHLLIGPAREGLAAFTGIWWDLGEPGTP